MPTGIPIASPAGANLYYVREMFAKRSGRADLVTSYAGGDFTDNGADYFINAAQRMLDSRHGHVKSERRHVFNLAVGEWYTTIEGLLAVRQVWRFDSDGKDRLEEIELATLLHYLDTTDTGTPEYWAKNIIGYSPELEDSTVSGFTGVDDMVKTDFFLKEGIIFNIPTDEAIDIHVYGRFKESNLVEDTDTSFWTVNYPEILVLASLYELEAHYNNMTGAKNWLQQIDLHLFGLEKDLAEFEMGEDGGVIAG